jgi:hypothetical protein
MQDDQFYDEFAARWIAAWNSHDIERILSFYAEDFEFTSPFLVKFMPATGGKLKGRKAVGEYWSKALAARPELKFEPVAVLKGLRSVVIHYKGLNSELKAEYFLFDAHGKVIESHAHEA